VPTAPEDRSPLLEKLLEVTIRLAEERDPGRVMERILDEGVAIVRAERGFVVACAGSGEGMTFRVVAARNLEREAIDRPESFSRTIVRRVAEGGAAQLVTDAKDDPITKNVTSIDVLDVRSIICVPLRAEGVTLGVLYLDHRYARRELSRSDLDAVETFARPAAVVLAAAQRREKIESQRDELARRVETIEQLRAELKDQYLERSREVNSLRDVQVASAPPSDTGLPDIVARSAAMKTVLDLVRKVAPSEASVLITGESGTGKEGLARALHALSPRARGPFRAENCAALADPLLESELFGHERGAFTGADSARPGLFEAAKGGTILLDEVGDMSASLQAKLLRVLQERTVRRLGGSQTIAIDVRVLAATHHDLERLVAEGLFRADLYYRLNVVRLEVPPLRARLACVPALVDHFFARFASQGVVIEPAVRDLLGAYPWPGNVRELQNEVHRLTVLAGPGGVIRPGMLAPAILAHAGRGPRPAPADEGVPDPVLPDTWRLEDIEREAILRALRRCGGNKTSAAKLLGIPKTTLYHRLEKLNPGASPGD
jgi:transcriptional regulator with GAF, ATPase, and Fis domain